MANGDTIGGNVRVMLLDNQGNLNRVFGPLPQGKIDYTNQTTSPEERQYVNTGRSSFVTAPSGAQKRDAPNAFFESGEQLLIQHQSSSGSGRSIDHTSDSFEIEGVEVDKTRGNSAPTALTQANQELTGTTAEDDSDWVTMYQYTIPDQTRFLMAGVFEAVAIEN